MAHSPLLGARLDSAHGPVKMPFCPSNRQRTTTRRGDGFPENDNISCGRRGCCACLGWPPSRVAVLPKEATRRHTSLSVSYVRLCRQPGATRTFLHTPSFPWSQRRSSRTGARMEPEGRTPRDSTQRRAPVTCNPAAAPRIWRSTMTSPASEKPAGTLEQSRGFEHAQWFARRSPTCACRSGQC
jgi:hypothetical protein